MKRIDELLTKRNELMDKWHETVAPWWVTTWDGDEGLDDDAPDTVREMDEDLTEQINDLNAEIGKLVDDTNRAESLDGVNVIDLYFGICGMDVELVEGPRWWDIRFRDGGRERFYNNSDLLAWIREALMDIREAYVDLGEVKEWNDAVDRVRERS